MAAESLGVHKLDASIELVNKLLAEGSPLLATFRDYDSEAERWTLMLVPTSLDERNLVRDAVHLLVELPFRSAFSLADPAVDNRQIDRARALGSRIRYELTSAAVWIRPPSTINTLKALFPCILRRNL